MPRAADLAYATVREGILGGRHPVGARLREEELALELGVSRTPVREALRRLDAEGLVEVLPNRGALVARWDDADLDEIFALRALLEGYGARQAAGRADAALLDRLEALCADMDAAAAAGDLTRVGEHNLEFHAAVLGAAGNRRLGTLLASVVHVPLVQRTFSGYTPDALARSLGHHRELVAALRVADGAWAESVMRAHVHAARASLSGGAEPPA